MGNKNRLFVLYLGFFVCFAPPVNAFDWSISELHYQYGKLDTPNFAGGGSSTTHILTFQHASGWAYGDNFLFVDYLNGDESNNFNDGDLYGELYLNFSLGKITKKSFSLGPIRDVGIIFGLNAGHDAKVLKYLPGVRLSWNLPGFTFLNTDFTAYIDDNAGLNKGGAPAENNSFLFDINGAYPIKFGKHEFEIQGHMEYSGERRNELGFVVSDWFLSQIQFRYDIGKLLIGKRNHIFAGIEWQIWLNKLGDKKTDENAAQALVVWRF
jgi:nucleoside-specific outer membrane channel protein Tsx